MAYMCNICVKKLSYPNIVSITDERKVCFIWRFLRFITLENDFGFPSREEPCKNKRQNNDMRKCFIGPSRGLGNKGTWPFALRERRISYNNF